MHDCKAQFKQSLDIIIVGAGIGGLATAYALGRAGHRITVVERSSAIAEVGAGIQAGPNLSRLLIRWGLGCKLEACSSRPAGITFLRYETGEQVGWTQWGELMEEEYGAPYYHIHRADLLDMLYSLARRHIHTLHLSAKVTRVSVGCDSESAAVHLADGRVLSGDLVIGADGLHSAVREFVLSAHTPNGHEVNPPIHTGYSAYRSVIPTRAIRALCDPALDALLARREMVNWMGPEKHVIGYSIRGGKAYNLVCVREDRDSDHADNAPMARRESYNAVGSVDEMRSDFAGWEPRLQKLLKLVDETHILPLKYREPLDGCGWVHPSSRVVLLGDAAHPTLPSRAQGAAMAVEDAAVLGVLLSPAHFRARGQNALADALHGYQTLRYERTAATQRASLANFNLFHLPDGPEQQARDASMRLRNAPGCGKMNTNANANMNIWADRQKSRVQFGYDAEEAAEVWALRRQGRGRTVLAGTSGRRDALLVFGLILVGIVVVLNGVYILL